MKRSLSFVLALVLTLLLPGCGACQHEWTPADCYSAAVCTKCNEEGEPALGHDWRAATCAAPETCARCGETQGDPLEHTFGQWRFEAEQMFRLCEVCGTEERTEADPNLYLQQVLPGHWDFYCYSFDGAVHTMDDLRYGSVGFYATLFEDGTCRIFDGSRVHENGSWTFTEVSETVSDGTFYYLALTLPDMPPATMALRDTGEEQQLCFYFNEHNYAVMQQSEPLASALAGSWSGSCNGTLLTLELHPDRTLTGNLDGLVTGTWHLEPVEENNGYRSCMLNVQYLKDGQPGLFLSSLSLGSSEEPLEDRLTDLFFTMWDARLGTVRFEKNDPETLRRMEAALEQGAQKLVGTWQSDFLRYYLQADGTSTETETTVYALTFAEDGSFTAQFDREYSGTWKFDNVELLNDEIGYNYTLRFDGAAQDSSVSIVGPGRICMSAHNDTHSLTGWFDQISDGTDDHAAVAPELIIGSWTAVTIQQFSEETQRYEDAQVIPCSLTVLEDGTFTADFGEPVTGTWSYSEHSFTSGYSYAFLADGADGGRIFSIPEPGTMNAFYDINGVPTTMTMAKD